MRGMYNGMNAFKMKKVSNTDINKLNWRFNHIFLVITNRDFYGLGLGLPNKRGGVEKCYVYTDEYGSVLATSVLIRCIGVYSPC